ncbi:hypothetical protein Ccar_07860 [Clostridium carboxidivorans P7]|nr:hypothetical protein [Clostridium carboxidivorans]AKN30756.1 hypothetical protein Ccar_07860 [Clostridium carboxidivorans P7]EFG88540.1 hypothetical protein CLCAR_1762 [Clostridium carboxidivorans P7]
MNKRESTTTKFLKALKRLKLYIIRYYKIFLKNKNAIDTMYLPMIQEKMKENKNLSLKLKNVQSKNLILEKEVQNLKASAAKKRKLIEDLQQLTLIRSDY